MTNTIQTDVAIIGGGIIGTAMARELSRFRVNVVLLEKEAEVGWGATKANSGIVHAGFHDKPGSLKAKYCAEGNRLYPQLCQELDVSFVQNGIIMAALTDEQVDTLDEYYRRGQNNGIEGLRILSAEEALALEPNLSPKVKGALHAPNGGVVSPFELAAALMENAEQNGVRLLTNCEVQSVQKLENGRFFVGCKAQSVEAKYVVNAAGLFADKIAAMAGDGFFRITPRKGEEYLMDKGHQVVRHTIFPVPSRNSKGMLAIPTSEGNLMIGPTGDDVWDRYDVSTTQEGFERISQSVTDLVPAIDMSKVITQFTGVRAASDQDDFIVQESTTVPGLIHLAGIESPGLTAAPAIAVAGVFLLSQAGLSLQQKENFQPRRRPVARFRELSREEQAELIRQDSRFGKVVCRCETVTEAEVADAISRGARTVDGVKFRTRSGCGRCQSGFCQPLVISIIAKELGIPVQQVSKRGIGTEPLQFAAKELLKDGDQDAQ